MVKRAPWRRLSIVSAGLAGVLAGKNQARLLAMAGGCLSISKARAEA